MEKVVIEYLKYLGISFSEEYCERIIVSHPDYPSLLSVSDAFVRLGIPCQIGRIESEHLSKIEFPFLIHQEGLGGGLVLVRNKESLTKDHIDLAHWNGIVLKAEPVAEIKDRAHNRKYRKERLTKNIMLVLAASLFGVLLIPMLQTFSWVNSVLLTTATSGFILGYLLIAKELGVTYKPVESFCNTSTRANCDKILNSEGGKIFDFFSLSEAVIIYFIFQLILAGTVIPFSDIIAPYLWVLIVLSALSIPIVVYSIYYQGVVAKTWCKLCMLVNAILVAQAVFLVVLFIQGTIPVQSIELLPFVFSLFLMMVVATSIVLVKEKFQKINEAVNEGIAANRLKYDPEVFTHFLLQGQKMDIGAFDKKMIIGNPTAPIKLIMVASLRCYPCKLAFEDVIALEEDFPNEISIELRFVKSAQNLVHGIPASTYLIKYWEQFIYGKKEEAQNTKRLIRDWYANMKATEFEKVYPDEPSITTEENGLGSQHFKWIIEHKINRTPTFLLNGYPLPSKYGIKDLAGLIPGLDLLIPTQVKEKVNSTNELAE